MPETNLLPIPNSYTDRLAKIIPCGLKWNNAPEGLTISNNLTNEKVLSSTA